MYIICMFTFMIAGSRSGVFLGCFFIGFFLHALSRVLELEYKKGRWREPHRLFNHLSALIFLLQKKSRHERQRRPPYAAFTGVTMWLFVVLEVLFFLWLDFGPGRRRFPLRKKPLCWCCGRWVRLDPICDFEDHY